MHKASQRRRWSVRRSFAIVASSTLAIIVALVAWSIYRAVSGEDYVAYTERQLEKGPEEICCNKNPDQRETDRAACIAEVEAGTRCALLRGAKVESALATDDCANTCKEIEVVLSNKAGRTRCRFLTVGYAQWSCTPL